MRHRNYLSLSLTDEELEVIKDALWNYQFISQEGFFKFSKLPLLKNIFKDKPLIAKKLYLRIKNSV
jgi:hypothetical protein